MNDEGREGLQSGSIASGVNDRLKPISRLGDVVKVINLRIRAQKFFSSNVSVNLNFGQEYIYSSVCFKYLQHCSIAFDLLLLPIIHYFVAI